MHRSYKSFKADVFSLGVGKTQKASSELTSDSPLLLALRTLPLQRGREEEDAPQREVREGPHPQQGAVQHLREGEEARQEDAEERPRKESHDGKSLQQQVVEIEEPHVK